MKRPIPPQVQEYLNSKAGAEQFNTPAECLSFIRAKIDQAKKANMRATPTYLEYMMGCTRQEAAALLRWEERER